MKNKLLTLLKTLFASKGFSQKALEGLADYLAPNLTEESTDAELSAAIETIKPMTDLMQSEINRQVNAAKPKPVEEPAKPVNEPAKPATDPNETPTEKLLRQALEGITALTAEVANIKGEKLATTRREQFIQSMKGTSAEYQARELKRFDRISFKDDDDFNSFMEDTKEDHAGAIQEEANDGLGGDRPSGGAGTTAKKGEKEVSPAMKELIAEREAKAKAAAQNA